MTRIAVVDIENGPTVRCVVAPGLAIGERDLCIMKTGGMLEFGRVRDVEQVDSDTPKVDGDVLRRATLQDQSKASDNKLRSKMAFERCVELAAEQGLEVHVIRVRYTFDRLALEVLFSSEDHIDTKELGRKLSAELQTRVHMRQIGVRDEAALVCGMGPCGRVLCCCAWLRKFDPVNVKMAKSQNLSLNPSAISGMCGRLKCCLRYECETYRSMGKNLPRQGEHVLTSEGEGKVIGRDILGQRVRILMTDKRVCNCALSELRSTGAREPNNGRPE